MDMCAVLSSATVALCFATFDGIFISVGSHYAQLLAMMKIGSVCRPANPQRTGNFLYKIHYKFCRPLVYVRRYYNYSASDVASFAEPLGIVVVPAR